MTALPKIRPAIPAPEAPPLEKQSITSPEPAQSTYKIKMDVMAMSDEGHSTEEIAEVLGITKQWVSSILIRNWRGSGRRGATRRVTFSIPARYYRNLKLAAEEEQKSPSAAVAHLLKGVLVDVPTARKGLRRK